MTSPLRNARLSWEGGLPHSVDFGDIYYSRADALGESTHVFLDGNDLQRRFAALPRPHFVVGELGFGAGLNFLNTCRLWCQAAPPQATLHYLACELHPFTVPDMRQLHERFPDLQWLSDALLAQFPDHTLGVHQLCMQLRQHRVCLTLLYGDALKQLQDYLEARPLAVDAWFLDGFSPKLNPALWEQRLLSCIASTAQPCTTLTSYSVAGSFRTALQGVGFVCTKEPGFAGKRHMLKAHWPTPPLLPSAPQPTQRRVCIVGGGLAGCSTAWALSRAGWQVELLERESSLAGGASGNLQGVLHCKPGTSSSPDNQFNLHSYAHAFRHYRLLKSSGFAWHECGMLHVGFNEEQRRRFERIVACERYHPSLMQRVDAATASLLAGIDLRYPALHFPQSGWLSPPELCRFYCEQAGVLPRTGVHVTALQQRGSQWLATSRDGECFECDAVILCNAGDLYDFPHCRWLPLIANRGQVDVYDAQTTSPLQTVLCGQGYLTPAANGLQSLGGSFYVEKTSQEQNRVQHLRLLERMDSGLAAKLAEQRPVQQRVGQRCQTPDRMPLVGKVDPTLPGLYVNAAHGSNGLARIPISAALLASELCGTPAPLPHSLRQLLVPQRFR